MKRYRYSDASEEKRKKVYLEALDKRKSQERHKSNYVIGGLSVLCVLSFIAVAGYVAYPFLEDVYKYRKSIETQINSKQEPRPHKQDIEYKDNCENWIHGF